jgi:hypothetical protein
MLDYLDWTTRLKTLRCKWFAKADLGRWADTSKWEDWEERTRIIARMISPNSRVIEFGAGKRLLERHLPIGSRYVPSDIVDRGHGTIILDLNARPLQDLRARKFDAAVFAGVLEYVVDLPTFVSWLARQVPACIASYNCANSAPRTLGRLHETYQRIGAGWTNCFSEAELVALFGREGFALERTTDQRATAGSERIFLFRQTGKPTA